MAKKTVKVTKSSQSSASTKSTLPPEIIETVSIGGMVSNSAQPAMLSNLAYTNTLSNSNLGQQNAVANQQALNQLNVATVGGMVSAISDLGPLESKSAVEVMTDNALAATIIDLKAAVAAFAEAKKQSTS